VDAANGSGVPRAWILADKTASSAKWIPIGVRCVRLGSNKTVNSSIMSSITAFSFDMEPDETWTAEFYLEITGNTNGIRFQVTGPSSPTAVRMHVHGNTTGVTAISTDSVTAFATATTTVFCSTTATKQFVHIKLCVANGANYGPVQLQVATISGTNSSTVHAGSYMVARPGY
jgi:hypothetical protein